MSDCIPTADFASISTFPPQVKAPIVGLAVVLSVVVVVAVIVVVILVRKLYALKKVGGNLVANAAVGGVGGVIAPGLEEDFKGSVPGIRASKLPGKLPNSNLNISIGASVDTELLTHSLSMGLDVRMDANSPLFVVFNALPYASIIVNSKGVIVKANAASQVKWGYTIQELEGRFYKDLVSPKEIEARLQLVGNIGRTEKQIFAVDSFDVRKDGVEIEVEVLGSVIHIVGKEYVFIMTGHVCYNTKGERYK